MEVSKSNPATELLIMSEPQDTDNVVHSQEAFIYRLEALRARFHDSSSDQGTMRALEGHLQQMESILDGNRPTGSFIDDCARSPSPVNLTGNEESGLASERNDGQMVVHSSSDPKNLHRRSEQLLQNLSNVALQLRRRYAEELNSIHLEKEKHTAHHISQLERTIGELEQDVDDDHSELSYLKLQLKALEVQALPHIPLNNDIRLIQGIQRWKQDWADVEQRFMSRSRCRQTPSPDMERGNDISDILERSGHSQTRQGFTGVLGARSNAGPQSRPVP